MAESTGRPEDGACQRSYEPESRTTKHRSAWPRAIRTKGLCGSNLGSPPPCTSSRCSPDEEPRQGEGQAKQFAVSSIVELPQPVFDDVLADQASLRFSVDDRLAQLGLPNRSPQLSARGFAGPACRGGAG